MLVVLSYVTIECRDHEPLYAWAGSMPITAYFEFVFDVFKLALYIACAYLALDVFARHVQTKWLRALVVRRFAVLGLLALLVIGTKVFEDVIAKESGPADVAVLWFIRQNMPAAFTGFFDLVTSSGAGIFLVPATFILAALFLIMKHRREALLVATSMACAGLLTFGIKALVDRSRPDLWSTDWYTNSSFPSGHTLNAAALATALVLCVTQIWPRSRHAALSLAVLWVGLVALSRLVLGAHWPTDVVAAISLGIFIPLAISLMLDLYGNGRSPDSAHPPIE